MNLTKATSSKGVGARAAPRVPRSRAGARAGAGARAWAGMVRVRPHPHQQSHSRLPRCQAIKTWEYMQPELYKMLESGDFVTSVSEVEDRINQQTQTPSNFLLLLNIPNILTSFCFVLFSQWFFLPFSLLFSPLPLFFPFLSLFSKDA